MLHTLTRSLRENKGPALVTVLLSALEVVFEIVIPLFMSNLIDFGIARFEKAGRSADTTLLGTHGYAAPEQFGFCQSDARADIYPSGKVFV